MPAIGFGVLSEIWAFLPRRKTTEQSDLHNHNMILLDRRTGGHTDRQQNSRTQEEVDRGKGTTPRCGRAASIRITKRTFESDEEQRRPNTASGRSSNQSNTEEAFY